MSWDFTTQSRGCALSGPYSLSMAPFSVLGACGFVLVAIRTYVGRTRAAFPRSRPGEAFISVESRNFPLVRGYQLRELAFPGGIEHFCSRSGSVWAV
jgi:hypothetical protein